MYRIVREKLHIFYAAISSFAALYLPVKKGEGADFALYKEGVEVATDVLKTDRSPKGIFFPQSEDMMKFSCRGGELKVEAFEQGDKECVLFGVRACDRQAFEVLDRVFLSEPVDTSYQKRREKTTVITLACSRPEESCFCGVFQIDATMPGGDVSGWLTKTHLYLEPNSEKGEKFMRRISELETDLFEVSDGAEMLPIREKTKEILKKLPFAALDLSKFTPENLNKIFDEEEVWKELSGSCLGCGVCTFVCPTCQCFDIRDFKTPTGVIRYRCWDSCMYSDFTLMAHGNSRTTQMQRYRQRFMHKLVYFPSQYGMYSCVGCGRCVDKCPQGLNIVKVIKKFGGVEV